MFDTANPTQQQLDDTDLEVFDDQGTTNEQLVAFDPPPREPTLDEEIARMMGEGCPNDD